MPETLRISGATSQTLLGYLKGLGLVRILGLQHDAGLRAAWVGGTLELTTALSAVGLEDFLVERWVPAPVVSPWNGGSGFFPKDNTEAFETLEADGSERLAPFRTAISEARRVLRTLGIVEKPDPKTQKAPLLRELRAVLPDDALDWMDAAIVLIDDGEGYPPVLGSGGNDGRYDIANNYAQAVVFALCLDEGGDQAREALAGALWDRAVVQRRMSLAHFFRDASAVNSPGGESPSLGNPWDLALAVHGTLLLGAGAGRRLASGAVASLVAPFTMRPTGTGYGSAVSGEKGRAELWLPLWEAPASLREIDALFREGRAQVGRRAARDGLSAVRAAGELGVARGINAFERFSILERAGQSSLAVNGGRIEVRPRAASFALRTLDPWLERVIRYGAGEVPRSQKEATRRLERAAFALAQDDRSSHALALLIAAGRVDAQLGLAPGERAPRPPWQVDAQPWLDLLNFERAELRIALGVASLRDHQPGLPSLRSYLHGVGRDSARRPAYGVHVPGSPPISAAVDVRLALLQRRRHQDAATKGRPLAFDRGIETPLLDLSDFVAGHLDDQLLGDALDGFAVLDFRSAWIGHDLEAGPIDPLLKTLALAWYDPRDEVPQPSRPRSGWAEALMTGAGLRLTIDDALRRLRLVDLPQLATADDLLAPNIDGRRLAAALLCRPPRSELRRASRELTDNALRAKEAHP